MTSDIPRYVEEQRQVLHVEHDDEKSKIETILQWIAARGASGWLRGLTLLLVLLLGWLLLFTLFGDHVAPSGDLFRLLVLVLCASAAAPLTALLRLPPLLGMLLTGILLRSVGFYHISGIYPVIVKNLRQTAMTVILIKAGLGLDAATLARLSLVVARLGLCPCTVEALCVAAATHYLLAYPWLWALAFGFLMSAISPAVVVPTLLDLQARGYGVAKGIPTLVLAACSLDDITAISMFSLFLGIIFSTGDLTEQMLQGPKDVGVGLLGGLVWGVLSGLLPHKDHDVAVWERVALVGGGGLCAVLGAPKAGFPSAGPLACVTMAFVANTCWKLQGPLPEKLQVADVFSLLWRVLEPVLYALIGAEVDLRVLDLATIQWGAALILAALLVRVVTCAVVLLGAGLSWKEILFVSLAWMPKATVQAALAPLPLDLARHAVPVVAGDLHRASQMLTVAVLSIIMTSPLGAVAASVGGPRLLHCQPAQPTNLRS